MTSKPTKNEKPTFSKNPRITLTLTHSKLASKKYTWKDATLHSSLSLSISFPIRLSVTGRQ